MSEACIFCKIIAGEIPSTKVFEDESVLAFLDIGPLSEGHTLLIPKEHAATLDELSADACCSLIRQLPSLCRAVSGAVEAAGYNVLINNGRAAGQLVDHVHFHIIPRQRGDGVIVHLPAGEYEVGRMAEVAERIKEFL
jgi:histidine triad (HIT) family protein